MTVLLQHCIWFSKELVYWAAVHHASSRLALGAFRTSPVQSLYVEANEPSINNRKIQLAMQYMVKLKTSVLKPAYNYVFKMCDESACEARLNYIRPMRLQLKASFGGIRL